jgi:hypothetical protein
MMGSMTGEDDRFRKIELKNGPKRDPEAPSPKEKRAEWVKRMDQRTALDPSIQRTLEQSQINSRETHQSVRQFFILLSIFGGTFLLFTLIRKLGR